MMPAPFALRNTGVLVAGHGKHIDSEYHFDEKRRTCRTKNIGKTASGAEVTSNCSPLQRELAISDHLYSELVYLPMNGCRQCAAIGRPRR
jgi:hypothetical protein